MNSRRRAVFLDRDGVLNRAIVREGCPYAPASLDELEILPGVTAACAALHAQRFLLIVVTNQPDVARGTQTRANALAMNAIVKQRLRLDGCEVCFHDDTDGCECRKPKPGMLTKAAREFEIDLAQSFVIGDRWTDIEAGRRAGCRTIFVDRGYREKRPKAFQHVCPSLADAAKWILTSGSNL